MTDPQEIKPLLSDQHESKRELEIIQGNAHDVQSRQRSNSHTLQKYAAAVESVEVPSYNGESYITQSSSSLNIGRDELPEHLKVSNLQSLMHLLKGNIGTGILAMPIAVSYAGLWVGGLGILLIGALATHCMHILLNCSNRLKNRTKCGPLDYASILEISLATGPKSWQKFAIYGRMVVNSFLMLTQFGFCCVYILFVATNIKQVVHYFWPEDPGIVIYLICVAALLIPYCLIRNLVHLAPFATFANILNTTGLLIVLQYVVQDLPDQSTRPAYKSYEKLPLYFGTALFTYEGIGLVMPIENKMKTPLAFAGFNGILNLGMTFICCLYSAMGWYGYLKFGDDAKGSVTLNLPTDELLYQLVLIMFSISLFISFGIQLYVPVKIIWPKFEKYLVSKRKKLIGECIFRIILVILTAVIASAVPELDLLISLVGALASSSLALMIPPLIEVVTFSADNETMPCYVLPKNVIIFLFGIVGCVFGTWTSIEEIVKTFHTSNNSSNQIPIHNQTSWFP